MKKKINRGLRKLIGGIRGLCVEHFLFLMVVAQNTLRHDSLKFLFVKNIAARDFYLLTIDIKMTIFPGNFAYLLRIIIFFCQVTVCVSMLLMSFIIKFTFTVVYIVMF